MNVFEILIGLTCQACIVVQFRKDCIGEGIRPQRAMNFGEAVFDTFIIGAEPSRPPK